MSRAAVDFLHPRRPSVLGWAVLLLGVASIFAAWHLRQSWSSERAELQTQLAAQQAAHQKLKLEAQRAAVPTASSRRLQRIQPLLRQPWLPTLRAIERVSDPPIYLYALAIEPVSGAVSVEGESPTFSDVLGYAAAIDLGGAAGPPEIRSHEQQTDPMGRSFVRFRLVGRWDSR